VAVALASVVRGGRRWTRRRAVVAAVVLAVVLVVLGAVVVLGGGGSDGDSTSSTYAPESSGADSGGGYGLADPAPAVAPDRAAEQGLSDRSVTEPGEQGVPVGSVGRSLVRSAQLTLAVEDPARAVQGVRTAAAAAGGTITQEQSGPFGGWVVMRVPAEVLDRTVDDVARLGTVEDRSASVEDATEEVVDLDARVASQQAGVARVRALLAQATSIGDVVAVESELSRREADLDSLTARLAALQDQVALSTLTVDLRGPGTPVVGPVEPVGFGDGLAAGWEGLIAVGRGTGAVVGFLLPFVPVLVVLAGAVWAVRRVRGRSRAAADPA
jgi:hypothetical protein